MKECDYDKIIVHDVDSEWLTIKCECGYGEKPWEFVITIYPDTECPKCGRKYYFKNGIKVFTE